LCTRIHASKLCEWPMHLEGESYRSKRDQREDCPSTKVVTMIRGLESLRRGKELRSISSTLAHCMFPAH
jgi:hypothetical protein